ncbi:glutathione S-transferase family protein [Asaia spathodeae]|uniref:Glutathione S-transferase family protein n=1 Tax=Asaia spathodeae TaxID=657016 RepID=A0ABX2P618_9PROT|nr:glutathione binding-like protein [Asaia spathodeae]GBR19083.1 glutathione S-transferase [Asaia spathodeae NBRC 105894]
MLSLNGWVMDERSYAARLAASLLAIPLTIQTDRRAEIFGPTLGDDEGVYCVGLYEVLRHFSRLPDVERAWPEGEARHALEWALEALESFSQARRQALGATLPEKAETDDVTLIFRVLEDRLSHTYLNGQEWLSGVSVGFIDIAVFPIAGLARDLGIGMDLYPAIRRFVRKVRQLPGFVTMPGIAACH